MRGELLSLRVCVCVEEVDGWATQLSMYVCVTVCVDEVGGAHRFPPCRPALPKINKYVSMLHYIKIYIMIRQVREVATACLIPTLATACYSLALTRIIACDPCPTPLPLPLPCFSGLTLVVVPSLVRRSQRRSRGPSPRPQPCPHQQQVRTGS